MYEKFHRNKCVEKAHVDTYWGNTLSMLPGWESFTKMTNLTKHVINHIGKTLSLWALQNILHNNLYWQNTRGFTLGKNCNLNKSQYVICSSYISSACGCFKLLIFIFLLYANIINFNCDDLYKFTCSTLLSTSLGCSFTL